MHSQLCITSHQSFIPINIRGKNYSIQKNTNDTVLGYLIQDDLRKNKMLKEKIRPGRPSNGMEFGDLEEKIGVDISLYQALANSLQ